MKRFDPTLETQLIDCATALAEAARPVTLQHFRTSGLVSDNKNPAGFDPVTEGDRQAETAMRHILAQRRPEDGILGEEFGHHAGTSGLTWVLDPIDGTRAFLAGAPTWGVLIAVGDDSGPALGVIDQPYIRERFFGGFGQAWCDGPSGRVPLATRPPRPLSDAILFTTFPEVGSDTERAAFQGVARQARLTRYGMDCYAYALIACGQADLVIEAGLNAYDIQGPMAVIEAAGGIVTDWRGGPAHQGGRVIAAANREVHAEALKVLSQADP
ncbi:inositol monophosphatase family protein [Oceaniglobus indicus]|uniref:inositol monophosphatase family protein n=1 Tax=Oceaniglobus indicus TaxID=2047749 RepID=UPI000C185393|nr:inositol monophosphatase family protein [Oceaniglobus indicus]